MITGRVYKLCSDNCEKVYIGSTHCHYPSVRMAHHRQNHRNGWKDYKGLFDNGDPKMEILEEIELEGRDDSYKLRELEQKWANIHADNCINIRRCYLSPEDKIKQRDIAIHKYHKSPLGKLALRKSYLNTKIKKLNNSSKSIHPSLMKQIQTELKFISEQQETLKNSSSSSYLCMEA
jgi:hypothetical protein